jgi:hypothetical protein
MDRMGAVLKRAIEANPGRKKRDSRAEREQSCGSHGTLSPRKASRQKHGVPVPQTDTGRQGELSPGDRATLC